jgi:hypothetical protein
MGTLEEMAGPGGQVPMAPPGRPGPARGPRTAGADTRPTPGERSFFAPSLPRASPRDPPQMGDQSFRKVTERRKNTANSAASQPQTGADPPFVFLPWGGSPSQGPPRMVPTIPHRDDLLEGLNVGDLTDAGTQAIFPTPHWRGLSTWPLTWTATNRAADPCMQQVDPAEEPQTLSLQQKEYASQLGFSWLPVAKKRGFLDATRCWVGPGSPPAGRAVLGAGIAAT